MVIIDTSVWIPALELASSPEKAEVQRLTDLDQAAIVGTVLVEVLRGARTRMDYERLSGNMMGAAFVEDTEESWLLAADILLELKLRGEIIPVADAIIAAQAIEGGHSVFTHDRHFQRIRGVALHRMGGSPT